MPSTRFARLIHAASLVGLSLLGCGSDHAGARHEPVAEDPSNGGHRESSARARAQAEAKAKAWAGWTYTEVPAGLAAPPDVPPQNPMTPDKVALGHRLFMDRRLSVDGSRSCYSCHQNQLGNADGRPRALGAGDKPLLRNTPTLWNVAYRPALNWDGRAENLEAQALGAWQGGNMGVGAEGLAAKAAQIGQLPEYADEFVEVFGLDAGAAVTPEHVVMALSAYERTLLCGDTEHDREAWSPAALRGWDLFRGKAQCTACHNGELFSDGLYHATGVGFDAQGRLREVPDPGRGEGRFRTPTLRNVAKTGPYFHDGSETTLEGAVRFMAGGGNPRAPQRDPLLRDVGLTDAEIDDVVAFLHTLDCESRLEVVGDQPVAGERGPLP